MIKAVFFDIDGTLYHHSAAGSVVPESTLRSLAAMRRKGIGIFVATGRMPSMLTTIREIFDFDGYVMLNGQLVIDRSGEVVHRKPHDPEDIRALIPLVHKEGFPCLIIEEEDAFMVDASPAVRARSEAMGIPFSLFCDESKPLYDVSRLDEHPVLQFLAFLPSLEEGRRIFREMPGIEPTSAGGKILDCIPSDGGKEMGIAAAAAHYGFAREEIMVCGDGINDIRMIRWAGTGVAMGNAPEEVKAAADYVTTSVDRDGIRNALLHFGVLTEEDLA